MNRDAVGGRDRVDEASAPSGPRVERARGSVPARPQARPTLRQRVVAAVVIAGVSVGSRLPEGLLWRIADVAGALEYRIARSRRELARSNLRRVARWMAENGVGDERYRRAAHDPRALEALVRSAFRHHARYYVELICVPRFDAQFIHDRLIVETPEIIASVLAERRAAILISGHFGSIELPALFGSTLLGQVTAPMETLDNPGIQAYIARTRASLGVRIVGLDQGLELVAALRRNEPVGLVADRDITGNGLPVEFFGGPARMPGGVALLAVESGAPVYVASVRRAGIARYRGNLTPLPTPSEGSRRERIRAMVQAQAMAFERMIAQAPDQWYAVFFPIWADAAGGRA